MYAVGLMPREFWPSVRVSENIWREVYSIKAIEDHRARIKNKFISCYGY